MKVLCVSFAAALLASAAEITGVWSGTMQAQLPGGSMEKMGHVLRLKQQGTSLTGRAGPNAIETVPIQNARFEDGRLVFDMELPNRQTAHFELRPAGGDRMTGTFSIQGRESLTGTVELKRGEPADLPPLANAGEIAAYDDVRRVRGIAAKKDARLADFSKRGEILATLTFNQSTIWPEATRMPASPRPADLLRAAMDPGLGVRELHKASITGKGVSVAIIDQPLIPDHPEYAGKIAGYKDVGAHHETSMHGPAVASLLVGKQTGTAPDAKLYFAAAPSWLNDTSYEAKALDWIVEQSRALPPGQKIRVVSISAAPAKRKQNADLWAPALRRAEAEGILVLDCAGETAIIGSCWFDGADRESPAACKPGFPGLTYGFQTPRRVLAPSSPRTTAEQYIADEFGYVYWGRGGQSWTVPYAAGVLALGWQLRPELTPQQAVKLLFDSAYQRDGNRIIDPPAFIRAVKEFRP